MTLGNLDISGSISVTHRLAGIIFRTETNIWLPRLQEGAYEQFLVEGLEPDVILRLNKVPLDLQAADAKDTGLLRSPQVIETVQASLQHPQQMGIDLDAHQVAIRNFARNELDLFYTDYMNGYDPARPANGAEYRIASNFRRLFSIFLARFSAVLVHSSGVIRNGRTALFLAHSGGGKTTITQTAPDSAILSDDQVLLRNTEDGVIAHSSPFGRITTGACQAPLGGIFILHKSHHFQIKPLSYVKTLEHLWGTQSENTYFLPADLRTQAFQVTSAACHQAPGYELFFPKDHVDWDAIDAALT